MRRPVVLGAILPIILAALPAQDAEYKELVADHTRAREAFIAALRELSKSPEYKKAVADRDREATTALRSRVPTVDTAAFVARFAAAAERRAGTDAAIDYLSWIVLNGRGQRDAAQAAADAIIQDHIKSERLLPLAKSVRTARTTLGEEGSLALCAALVEQSPHDQVKAWTLYWRASNATRSRTASDADKAQAEVDLARAAELAPPESLLAMRIAGPIFEAERLQIGMEAPDIAGEDIDGVPFKLSDYRGKVVVLDFWGDW